MFQVGDKVRITKRQHGGGDAILGSGVVAKVGARKTTLADGSEWRTDDGYPWGSRPTRGSGRNFERKIAVKET
jgi:hypothetical protein